MKNINPSTLPHFHGLINEYLNTFLFYFLVICKTYYYTTNEQNHKCFPSSLKDSHLRWFMNLEGNCNSQTYLDINLFHKLRQ